MTQSRWGVMAIAIVASFACAGGAASPEPAPEEQSSRDLPIPDGNRLRQSAPAVHRAGELQPAADFERQGSRAASPDEALEQQVASGEERPSSPRPPPAARQLTRATTPEEALEEYAASLKAERAPAPRSKGRRIPSGEVEATEAR